MQRQVKVGLAIPNWPSLRSREELFLHVHLLLSDYKCHSIEKTDKGREKKLAIPGYGLGWACQ